MAWYHQSISDMARQHGEQNHVSYEHALSYAFDLKYGDYDYKQDLRELYPNWAMPIKDIFSVLKLQDPVRILDVGSNTGQELNAVFSQNILESAKITCVDISHRALAKTAEFFSNASMINARMENLPIPDRSQDVYLNLRAVMSTGVDVTASLNEAHRVLDKKGLAIFSIANGYLADDQNEMKGLYDKQTYDTDKAYSLALNLLKMMGKQYYKGMGVIPGPTEIFAFGLKH